MPGRQTFLERALNGEFLDVISAIDDEIELWHGSDSTEDLHDWLGMTWDEYALFVQHPSMLHLVLKARNASG